MKPIEIAKLLNISRQRVNYWVHHEYQLSSNTKKSQ